MSTNTRKERAAKRKAERQERKANVDALVNPQSFIENIKDIRDNDLAAVTPQGPSETAPSAIEQASAKLMQDANKSAEAKISAPTLPTFTGGEASATAPTRTQVVADRVMRDANASATRQLNVGTPSLPTFTGGEMSETAPEKPKSFADILSERYEDMRKAAKREKTDAAKMQKYYALTDALRAIGQLGGTAVGGAIGGDLPDSAPAVDPYKESRGYLDAFERAKKANDRIKELDEKGFSLALRDEQRAYDQAMREEDRAYKEKLDALDKQWQKDFYDYRSKIDQAIAQGNMELQAKLREEQEAREQEYWEKRNAITQQHDINMKAWSERIVNKQMGLDANGNPKEDGVDFAFYDDNVKPTKIPAKRYKEMLAHYASMGKIGDTVVDEENVVSILKSNPQLVKSFLAKYGEGGDIVIPEKQADVVVEDSEPTNRTFEEVNAEDLSARKRRKEEIKNTSKVQPYSTSADFIKAVINGSMQKGSNDESYIDEDGIEWE